VDPRLAADRGYAVVVQDVRGRGGAGGEFEPYVREADDGYDSVEWVASQPWCDGRVVMAGCPDGRWDNLTEGIARAPADADEVVVPLGDVCVACPTGARLVVLVAGASFPRWDQAGTAGPRVVREGSSVELTLADI
jgi:predicted acyl esterase